MRDSHVLEIEMPDSTEAYVKFIEERCRDGQQQRGAPGDCESSAKEM